METNPIQTLSAQLNCPDIANQLSKRIELLEGELTRICVTGGSNVGKSTFINAMVGTHLEVSSLPTQLTSRVVPAESIAAKDSGVVISDSEWLKKGNYEIIELPDVDLNPESTPIEATVHFAHTDICIMLLNAMAALSRLELRQLEVLDSLGIPTMLILSKTNQLPKSDYDEVLNYIERNIKKFCSVQLLREEQDASMEQLTGFVCQAIDSRMADTPAKETSRAALRRAFETDALNALAAKCKEKIHQVAEAIQKVDSMSAGKRSKLSDSATLWLRLQSELSQRKDVTASKIREAFEKKKNEIIRQLCHNVEMCNDVKVYWEKELPYRLEDIMKMNAQTATQLINADVTNTINWLNQEVKKSFHKNLNTIQPISYTIESSPNIVTDNPDIADNKKLRIVTRVGTAVTVIAAGTMCATMGIGGIIMAVSMMSGIGAEYFMNRKQNESKKKVQELIPQVVEQAQQKLIIDVSDNLSKAYSDLLGNLQAYQDEWISEAEQNIEKEHQIALYNCQVENGQWEKCMQEINNQIEIINK